MSNANKWIIAGIVVSMIVFFVTGIFTTKNVAIGKEESISQSISDIKIQEKRRHDLILNLVDTVEANAQYESNTLMSVTQMRETINNGNVEQAITAINAVAEAYPSLQATEGYIQLMNELSITENLVSEHRKTFNKDVMEYKKFVRRFPNSLFLSMSGYDIMEIDYLQYTDEDTQSLEGLFDK